MPSMEHVTYAGYLRLTEVLEAQHPVSPPELGPQVHAAEHFFIVVHQTFELWFKQLLLDLRDAADALMPPSTDTELALDHLQRVAAIQRLLTEQMLLFNHLPPRSFLAFRPFLGRSSGSESRQFYALQEALGLRGHSGSPIYAAFRAAMMSANMTLDLLYHNPSRGGALYRVAEALVDISEGFWQVTLAHVRVIERTIGERAGTAGTSGADYVAQGLKTRAFPELWDVRTRL